MSFQQPPNDQQQAGQYPPSQGQYPPPQGQYPPQAPYPPQQPTPYPPAGQYPQQPGQYPPPPSYPPQGQYPPQGGVPPYAPPAYPGGPAYPPAAPYAPYGAQPAVAYAGFWRRFLAVLIDGIIISIPVLIIASALGLGSASAAGGSANASLNGPGTLLDLVAFVLYDAILLTVLGGRTIGKMALGIRVTGMQGEQITFGTALVRSLMKIVSGIPFYLGYLWMLWDPNKQTWHDKVAKTIVVKR